MKYPKKLLKIQKYCIAILLGIGMVFAAAQSRAAELSVSGETRLRVGDRFEAQVFLRSADEYINGVAGTIRFPAMRLELEEIRDGNSVINFWIERPRVASSPDNPVGEVKFSGITPGGYRGAGAPLFTLFFRATSAGSGTIAIANANALRNDGAGTRAALSFSPLGVTIGQRIPGHERVFSATKEDHDPPEAFEPEVTRIPDAFDGKYVLVFAAQDKGSGIDYYAVYESRQRKHEIAANEWKRTASPYVLEDQELKSYIWVQAVDRADNRKTAVLSPPHPSRWYENHPLWAILILLGIMLSFRPLWRKLKQR